MDAGRGADERFAGIADVLPPAARPHPTVTQTARSGTLLVTAGQVALVGGALLARGVVGEDVDVATGTACARQGAVNLLARVQEELGTLDDVVRVLRLTVLVASAPGFVQQADVAHGASELVVEVLGERGRHARTALGSWPCRSAARSRSRACWRWPATPERCRGRATARCRGVAGGRRRRPSSWRRR